LYEDGDKDDIDESDMEEFMLEYDKAHQRDDISVSNDDIDVSYDVSSDTNPVCCNTFQNFSTHQLSLTQKSNDDSTDNEDNKTLTELGKLGTASMLDSPDGFRFKCLTMIANDRMINQRNCTISSGSSRNDRDKCDKRQLVDEKLKEEDPNADHFSKTSVTNKRQRTLTVEPVSSWMDVEFSKISSLFGQFELHNLNGPKSTDLREKILFRFPFHGEHTVIEEASAGTCLKCIGGPLGASHTKATTTGHKNHGASMTATIDTEMLARNRICITGNEVYRLSKKIECEYLKDELVHFGIKWLTRKSIGREKRDKDFMSLTSYVYTLLNSST